MNLWCLSSIFSLEFTLMYDIFKIFWRCSTICCCINYIPILLFTKFWIYLVMNGVSREFVNMLIVFIVFIDSVGCSLLFIICVKYILVLSRIVERFFIEIIENSQFIEYFYWSTAKKYVYVLLSELCIFNSTGVYYDCCICDYIYLRGN